MLYSADILINIDTSRENTNACTNATRMPCTYTIMGKNAGKFIPRKATLMAHNHKNATLRRIDPEDIFPNNLIDKDITFAKVPTISKSPMKSDINISHIFAPILFHSSSHFPVIGIYSCKNFRNHKCFACTYKDMTTAMIANAKLNSSSAVAEVTFLSHRGKKNLITSFNNPIIFANNITKKSVVT